MPSYAGAVAAIEAKLRAEWLTTSIAVMNPTPEQAAAVVTSQQNEFDEPENIPWAQLEIAGAGAAQAGVGRPGWTLSVQDGLISVHVFVPINSGDALARQHASAIGEIFRNKEFYSTVEGFRVRSWTPRVDDGDSGSEDGLWFRVTVTIPFEYWHTG